MKRGLISGAVVVSAMLIQGRAGATWPSGAAVTFPGYECAAPFIMDGYGHRSQYCPYVSDSFHQGGDVPTINVDISATIPSGEYAEMGFCAQSWTGSEVACFFPDPNITQTTTTSGYSQLWLPEAGAGVLSQESWLSETSSPWDYYYVDIYWRSAENTVVYGYSFCDEGCEDR